MMISTQNVVLNTVSVLFQFFLDMWVFFMLQYKIQAHPLSSAYWIVRQNVNHFLGGTCLTGPEMLIAVINYC